MVERLSDLPRPLLLARGDLQVAAGQIDADPVAVDMVERLVRGDVSPPSSSRRSIRPRDAGRWSAAGTGSCAIRHQHVAVLGKEERRRPLVISHLADVLEVIAPDAPDAANRIGFRFTDDGSAACAGLG